LLISQETGFFRTSDDYRVSDWAIYRPDQASARGTEGAELVVEIRSPGDESLAKIPWYVARGCREVLIVDRDTLAVELHGPDGPLEPARSDVLGATFTTVDGPGLRVEWDGGATVLHPR
jgi:Uma2 family endonuclease